MLRFGPFGFDPRTGELYREGRRIRLQDQPSRVLALLIEHSGELVTRDELRNKLWPHHTFVDFDHGVNIAVNKLRDALGDAADKPRFIETLPRRGYRFIAPLDAAQAPTAGGPPAVVTSASGGSGGPDPFAWRRRALRPAVLAPVLLVALAAAVLVSWRGHFNENSIRSLAVLPFENLSGDPNQEYFVDGMTDELTTQLAKIKSLRVISRTSAMQFKNVRRPLGEIARSLHVQAVVEGSVVRFDGNVRITVQLIDARTDQHLWAEDYHRDLRDSVALQGEVAERIAHEVRTTLTSEEKARLSGQGQVNPEAYEAYLRGRYFWNKRTEESLKKAIAYFEESIRHDPNAALPYDGLADCWLSLGWYGYLPPNETFPRAKAAAGKALELDGSLGEAHTSLAFAAMNYDWDWSTAGREFRRAIELNPNYANAHHWYADYLSAVGRHQEAVTESKRALELDPISPIINAWLGWRYFFARQYELAIQQYVKTLEIDPSFAPAHLVLGLAYEQQSQPEQAIAELTKAADLAGGRSLYVSSLAHAYAIAGRRGHSEELLRQLRDQAQRGYVPAFHIAIVYAGLAQKDQALAWLEQGYQERSAWMVWLKVDPRFDALRSDPRFQDLLHRIGLA
jgi:TolB-like protein/DNA-binding winged helix-turn-helix (wHTH) protein/Tfp pilus assembly protein PilF